VWITGRRETDNKIGKADNTVLFVLNFVADIHLGCVVWHALCENVFKRGLTANQVKQNDCSGKNLPQSGFSLWLDKHLAYGVVTWYAGLRQNCLSGVQMLKGMTMCELIVWVCGFHWWINIIRRPNITVLKAVIPDQGNK